jgi:hypothetical protein
MIIFTPIIRVARVSRTLAKVQYSYERIRISATELACMPEASLVDVIGDRGKYRLSRYRDQIQHISIQNRTKAISHFYTDSRSGNVYSHFGCCLSLI